MLIFNQWRTSAADNHQRTTVALKHAITIAVHLSAGAVHQKAAAARESLRTSAYEIA
jgi:hypothetical protein